MERTSNAGKDVKREAGEVEDRSQRGISGLRHEQTRHSYEDTSGSGSG